MALAISYMAYSYTVEARNSDNRTQWNIFLHEYQQDSFNQVNLLNCYQYFANGDESHPLSETLMIDVNKRFNKSKWDKETDAEQFQERMVRFSSVQRENRMRIFNELIKFRTSMPQDIRNKADVFCKGSFANL